MSDQNSEDHIIEREDYVIRRVEEGSPFALYDDDADGEIESYAAHERTEYVAGFDNNHDGTFESFINQRNLEAVIANMEANGNTNIPEYDIYREALGELKENNAGLGIDLANPPELQFFNILPPGNNI